jgi:hypothetical protein
MEHPLQMNDPKVSRPQAGISPPQTAYQGHHAMPIQPIISPSPTIVGPASPMSSQTGYKYETSQVTQYAVSDAEKGEVVPNNHYLNNQVPSTGDPITYFRRHRITAPWLDWVDAFEPDTQRRWWKRPKRVKMGTRSTSDYAERQRYAWQHVFPHGKHEGPGYRMRDAFGRVHQRPKDERYISSFDGGLKELVVQCTDDLFYQRNDAPWIRARIRDLAPYALRVSDWCAWNVKHPGISKERRILRRIVGPFLLFFPVSRDSLLILLNIVDVSRFHGVIHRSEGSIPEHIEVSITRCWDMPRWLATSWKRGTSGLMRSLANASSRAHLSRRPELLDHLSCARFSGRMKRREINSVMTTFSRLESKAYAPIT